MKIKTEKKEAAWRSQASSTSTSTLVSTPSSCVREEEDQHLTNLDVRTVEGGRASSSPPSSLASPSASVGSMTAPQPLERGRKETRTPDLGKFNGTLCAQTCCADRLIRFCKCKTTGENCCKVVTDQCVRTAEQAAKLKSQGIREEARPKISNDISCTHPEEVHEDIHQLPMT